MAKAKAKIDKTAWRDLVIAMHGLEGTEIRVGAVGAAARASVEGGTNMAGLVATHEFGSPARRIPERPFIRSTATREQRRIGTLMLTALGRYVNGGASLSQELNKVGAWFLGQIRATVTRGAGVPPPNAPATVARKKSDRPLVDTGRMLQSLSWLVEMGRAKDRLPAPRYRGRR